MNGVFITFEGGEGTGKSTQLQLLAKRLRAAGCDVCIVREPGGTAAGEAIRRILLDPSATLDPVAELLLYEAARAQVVRDVIAPSLARGEVVLCDRFFDSTTAYQGYGRGLDLDVVRALHELATGGLAPDRTIVLDLDHAWGLSRATREGADRLEREDAAFHARVREGFLAIARQEPGRVRVIDASGSVDEVAVRVVESLRDVPQLRLALGER